MGCFPLLALFVLGTGIGYAVDGRAGAVWGAGAGVLAGVVAGLALMWVMRRSRRDDASR